MAVELGNKQVEQIARVCHEANRAYCHTLGDSSQLSWEDAPEWQKASAIAGVKFRLSNPDTGPEASHQSWSNLKYSEGWTYGEKKDSMAKTHPCLVSFDKLPVDQQKKDHLFLSIVKALSW